MARLLDADPNRIYLLTQGGRQLRGGHRVDLTPIVVAIRQQNHNPTFAIFKRFEAASAGSRGIANGGGQIIWESNAICQLLCERHGDSAFYPRDSWTRADIARWLFWEASAWGPVAEILTHENVRKPMLGIGEPDPVRVVQGEEQFRPLASLLDEQLGRRPFLVGNSVTLADFVVGGAVTYVERGRFPVAEFRNLQAWWERLHQIPAWNHTVPSPDLPE